MHTYVYIYLLENKRLSRCGPSAKQPRSNYCALSRSTNHPPTPWRTFTTHRVTNQLFCWSVMWPAQPMRRLYFGLNSFSFCFLGLGNRVTWKVIYCVLLTAAVELVAKPNKPEIGFCYVHWWKVMRQVRPITAWPWLHNPIKCSTSCVTLISCWIPSYSLSMYLFFLKFRFRFKYVNWSRIFLDWLNQPIMDHHEIFFALRNFRPIRT